MARAQPLSSFDTVVVGSGPSALILSYILHGHIPYYDSTNVHPDPILHQKLLHSPCLLDVEITDLTTHFGASRISYSTQALPVNVLLDTLLRPLADTNPGQYNSCVQWRYEPNKRVDHVVLGNTVYPGGQWAESPVAGSWDIGALSYAEMLSLPGYSLLEHLRKISRDPIEDFYRPSRREVAEYLKMYPTAVGIDDSIHTSTKVEGVSRVEDGFVIKSHNIRCKHLVLASGTFSNLVPARPLLQPLLRLPSVDPQSDSPLLVVGSGFTAADVILSTPPERKVIHIFKWAPDEHPSPLRACHPRAYPEYAGVYRRMKLSAKKILGSDHVFSPMRKKSNPFERADWGEIYEGLPNTYIKAVKPYGSSASITLETSNHDILERQISGMQYVIGRRGSLEYLDETLLADVLRGSLSSGGSLIAGKTLRSKVEENLEVAQDSFVTGSLTGDSLVRFAFGGCVYAAREIMRRRETSPENKNKVMWPANVENSAPNIINHSTKRTTHDYEYTNGHSDLEIDMKSREMLIDYELAKSELWGGAIWPSGGCSIS